MRAGEGIEVFQSDDGKVYDTRRDGRAWKYDQDWENVVRDARREGHRLIQVIDATGYRETVAV